MQKKYYIAILFILLLSCNSHKIENKYSKDTNYIPDLETAKKIAEAVWWPIYGEDILLQKPFIGKLENEIWYIEGNTDYMKKNRMIGGVAHVEIQKSDGKILNVYHTK